MPFAIAAAGLRRGTAGPAGAAPPAIGLVIAVEDVHQRRLAGAVLADQPVNRAARDDEIDIAIRRDRAEALADPAQLDRGNAAVHRRCRRPREPTSPCSP